MGPTGRGRTGGGAAAGRWAPRRDRDDRVGGGRRTSLGRKRRKKRGRGGGGLLCSFLWSWLKGSPAPSLMEEPSATQATSQAMLCKGLKGGQGAGGRKGGLEVRETLRRRRREAAARRSRHRRAAVPRRQTPARRARAVRVGDGEGRGLRWKWRLCSPDFLGALRCLPAAPPIAAADTAVAGRGLSGLRRLGG